MAKTRQEEIKHIFEEIMRQCKAERKAKTKKTIRELSKDIGVTENYISAIESGREVPSLTLFIKYLLCNNFDLSALKCLEIQSSSSSKDKEVKEKQILARKIYSLSTDQVEFLSQQASMVESYGINKKKKKSK